MMNRRGFVLMMVMAFILILAISSASIFFMVGSETVQARRYILMAKAFYAAEGGAERAYTYMKTNPASATNKSFSGTLATGSFTATSSSIKADPLHPGDSTKGIVTVTSTGTSDGISRDVVVDYALENIVDKNPSLVDIGDLINLQGHTKDLTSRWSVTAGIDIAGPVAANGSIVINEPEDAVTIAGQSFDSEDELGIPSPQFMDGNDANRDGNEITDTTGDGYITVDDIPINAETGEPDAWMMAVFNGDDVNDDGFVDEKDGFTHYYTKVANYADVNGDEEANDDLGMDPDAESHPNYYSGDQTFGPTGVWNETIPTGTNAVFVDGNADIMFSPQSWTGESDITVIATGDITIVEPCNGDNDRLNLISYGDVATGGINLQGFDVIDANLNVYAHGDFYAVYGGDTQGTVIANEDMDMDTVPNIEDIDTTLEILALYLFSREIGNVDNILGEDANRPIGLPCMNPNDTGDNLGINFQNQVCKMIVDFDLKSDPRSWTTSVHHAAEE